MNMMRTWAIWGTVYATGEPLETLEIDAESFDDALNIARTVHPDYCAGQVIGYDLKQALNDPELRHKCIVDFVEAFVFVLAAIGAIYGLALAKMWGWF